MTERKRDWEVITGWEKRIKVDFGSIGPNHVRWSDWTYKERDIVARKVHESHFVSKEHGNRSKKMEEWAKEHAPIMIDFARDGKPMPEWAHADYRESGVPEHVQVVWRQPDPAGPGDWAYDPPGPWNDKGEEPAWSARPMEPDHDPNEIIGLETEGKMDPKFGGVVSYRTAPNGDHIATDGTVISTAESRAKEDVPQWRKFELGRLDIVDDVVIPGPNALPKDEEQYGENRKLTGIHKTRPQQQPQPLPGPDPDRIMPDDPNYTPMEKALSWAKETHHGEQHQIRWRCAAAALGATPEQLIETGGDGTAIPMTLKGARKWWNQFNRNRRWSMLVNAMEDAEYGAGDDDNDDIAAANRYREAVGLPPVEESQADKLHRALVKVNEREAVAVKRFDPEAQEFVDIEPAKVHIPPENQRPAWAPAARHAAESLGIAPDRAEELIKETQGPVPQYRIPGTMSYGPDVPPPGSTGWYTREIEWLPQWYWDLPAITDDEATDMGATSRASVAPLNYIYHKKGVGILGRLKLSPVREDLPIWTKDQAEAYYRGRGIRMRSRQWLDGHLMQQPGYTDTGDGNGKFVARAASDEYEAEHKTVAVPNAMAAAIEVGDWAEVARLAERAEFEARQTA